jgi:hypothetical protein
MIGGFHMEIVLISCVILIILGALGIVYATRYNKIIIELLKTQEAEVNIDQELRNKYDDIIRCINIIERKLKLDIKTFEEVKKIKSDKISNFEVDRILSKCLEELLIITEDYPKVKETKSFNDLIKDMSDIEEHLIALRSYYNKYTFIYNKCIKTFPDTIISKIHHFNEKPFYDGKNLNDTVYTDFKI